MTDVVHPYAVSLDMVVTPIRHARGHHLAHFLGALLGPRQSPGEVDGGPHAGVVGLAGTGDIEGGAVVHAGAEERQADGDVHAGVEAHELHWDVYLIVI